MTRQYLSLLLAAVLGVAHFALPTDARCFQTNESGVLFDLYRNALGEVDCRPGFYCPNLNTTDNATWPQFCIPSPECALKRAQSEQCDGPQGLYEPTLCPRGSYCPTSSQQLPCPSGHWCRFGTVEPHKCGVLSLCPEGSAQERDLSSLLATFLVAVAVVLIRKVYVYFHSMPTREVTTGNPFDVLLEGFRRARGDTEPLTFEFQNLSLKVRNSNKRILEGANGILAPGKVTAIMGPSGAGKTSLFNTLLGKIDPSELERSGSLRVNGTTNIDAYRNLIGYVAQDDVLHTELSVMDNFFYASEMRLPASWTAEQRKVHREAVAKALRLWDIHTSHVGDWQSRGISGGERKRVSIGMELAAAPLALFLDEPTTGLDATTALELCRLLKEIAVNTNITVAMVIHQPRVEIWEHLDDVLLLAPGGHTVYQGPQKDVEAYFGHYCPRVGLREPLFDEKRNPADDIIDVITKHPVEFTDAWAAHDTTAFSLASPQAAATNTALVTAARQPPSFLWQAVLVHTRSVQKQLEVIQTLVVEMIVVGLCGFVIGNASADNDYSGVYVAPYERISPADSGFVVEMTMYMLFSLGLASATAGVRTFSTERDNYRREAAAGCSRGAYFLGNATSVTYRILISTQFFCTVYHILAMPVVTFRGIFGVIFLCYFGIYGVSTIVAMIVRPVDAALVASTSCVALAMFSGAATEYPHFLQRMTFPFYASEALFSINSTPLRHIYKADAVTAPKYSFVLDIEVGDHFAMFGLVVFEHVIAFVCMLVFLAVR